MSLNQLENQNPHVYSKSDERTATLDEEDDSLIDAFDRREIFGKYTNADYHQPSYIIFKI